jgi:hypothetical protein
MRQGTLGRRDPPRPFALACGRAGPWAGKRGRKAQRRSNGQTGGESAREHLSETDFHGGESIPLLVPHWWDVKWTSFPGLKVLFR